MDENNMCKCDFCYEFFSDEEILSKHVLSIHKSIIEGKKKCDICDKTYRTKLSLYQHVNMEHSNEKSYECETCTKVFLNESTLNRHKKSIHLSNVTHVKKSLPPNKICRCT